MRSRRAAAAWLALFASLAGIAGALRGQPEREPEAARIAALIRQLGDEEYIRREGANRELQAIGEKALAPLRHAAIAGDDPEVRRRAREAVRLILKASCKSKSTGLQLVPIEPGTFRMGSPVGEPNRRPDEAQHLVRITRPFILGAYEVTQDQYQQVMKANPSWFSSTGRGKGHFLGQGSGRFPVDSVTWFDAVEFCNRLSRLDGYDPYYHVTDIERDGETIRRARVKVAGGNGYRLPTEAEWEYACRSESTTAFHFGRDTYQGALNCKPLLTSSGYASVLKWPDLARTSAVGTYKPNVWGLYDMHGNVGEWCNDWYDRDYYAASPANDPPGPDTGTHRVVRGGSWLVTEGSCRSASRFFHPPDESNYITGFRVARAP